MRVKAEIFYTTSDGIEHRLIVTIAEHPIISLNRVMVDGVEIPISQIRLFTENA